MRTRAYRNARRLAQQPRAQARCCAMRMQVGLDRLIEDAELAPLRAQLRAQRLALLAHPASVDRRLHHATEALAQIGVNIQLLFGPEHGLGGHAQYMDPIADQQHGAIQVRSLYGARAEDLQPRAEDFAEIDVLLIDLQDVGARYYTYVWTALLAAQIALAAGAQVLVLDRPNPLGLLALEGSLPVESRYLSFVGLQPLPIRHGLTLGEIVLGFAGPHPALRVLAPRGLPPDASAHDWDRPFVPPSPNMPTADTALVYPGGCLLEGTNVSEGRGTCRPFEILGAPFLNGERLAREYHALKLPGAVARPLQFQPTFDKHAGLLCAGVQLHVTCARTFRPVASYAALLALAQRQAPRSFHFRTEAYEFRDDVPALDLLAGGPWLREAIAEQLPPAQIAEQASAVDDAARAAAVALRRHER